MEEAGQTRLWVKRKGKRQAVLFGHIMRNEHLITIGKLEGRQD